MGNRAFIQIESERFQVPIVLYGHWSGEDNRTAVLDVLARTDRVGDPSYLTAQIFHEFSVRCGNYDGSLGFGISAYGSGIAGDGDVDGVFVNADNGKAWLETGEVIAEPSVGRRLAF